MLSIYFVEFLLHIIQIFICFFFYIMLKFLQKLIFFKWVIVGVGGGSVSGDSPKASTISLELNMRSCIKRQAIFGELIYFLFVSDLCRQIEFDHSFDGKRLKNHVIRTAEVQSERSCRTLCYMEPNCVSYNFNKVIRKCELNNSTLREGEENMESNPGYAYCGAKVCKVLQIMKLCKKTKCYLFGSKIVCRYCNYGSNTFWSNAALRVATVNFLENIIKVFQNKCNLQTGFARLN